MVVFIKVYLEAWNGVAMGTHGRGEVGIYSLDLIFLIYLLCILFGTLQYSQHRPKIKITTLLKIYYTYYYKKWEVQPQNFLVMYYIPVL